MAKSIILSLGEESSSFSFSRLDRAKLYGYKERQIVDTDGERCTSAYLTSDGAAIVPSGGLAMVYVDDGFSTIERSALKTVDDAGAELPIKPSTLGVAQALEGPVPEQRLLDHMIHTVYELSAEEIGATLASELDAGKIFSAPFSYRDDYEMQTMFVLKGDGALFALIGEPNRFDFLRHDAAPVELESAEDESEELDFSMM
ncbi:MAG: hypothetical protein JO002_06890 [Burkholderiaceae bacterium]|nr:hypothetical protein [Burkholderiaceae bacterium]